MSLLVGVGSQMNKFERVSSDHHQMSRAGGRPPGLMSRGGGGSLELMSVGEGVLGLISRGGGYLPCDLWSHDAFDVTYPSSGQIDWQTHACEKTLLRLRAVKKQIGTNKNAFQ